MAADLATDRSTRRSPGPGSACIAAPARSPPLRATAEDARLLAIATGDPLLVERRVIVDRDDRRIEATESRYAADRYGLGVQFDVEGPDQGGAREIEA